MNAVAMIIRVWILYKKSVLILRALLVFYVIEIVQRLVACVMFEAMQSMGMLNIFLHYARSMTEYLPNYTAPVIAQVQVLDFSFCTFQAHSSLAIWTGITLDIVQIILGGVMCLLVGVQFIRQSFQMYRATRRFELGCYMSLLTREGLFYFLVYV